jgi:hypothetical protein
MQFLYESEYLPLSEGNFVGFVSKIYYRWILEFILVPSDTRAHKHTQQHFSGRKNPYACKKFLYIFLLIIAFGSEAV